MIEQVIEINHSSDLAKTHQRSVEMATALGFDEREREEISLVVKELATNIVKFAARGTLTLSVLTGEERDGIRIDAMDNGPGISDTELALEDGYSTAGTLGYGLGTAHRLMSRLDIESRPGGGTHIICRRYLRKAASGESQCPVAFGIATRPHPGMNVNGDAFIIKKWGNYALAGIIDGVGHGQWAHKASQVARNYIEGHFDQPLTDIFRGVGRACSGTRGVVMALARFDWEQERLGFASVGNIETRVFGNTDPISLPVRRGVIGMNAPKPVITDNSWTLSNTLVMHSDGLSTRWRRADFPGLETEQADVAAQRILNNLAKDDDATVIVIRGK